MILKKIIYLILWILFLTFSFLMTRYLSSDIEAYNILIKYHYYPENCQNINIIEDKENLLYIDMPILENGNGNCIKSHLKDKKYLIIQNNYGGLAIEALYLSDFLQKENINLIIHGVCVSACSVLLFSTKNSYTCESNTIIGIHQHSSYNNFFAIPFNMELKKASRFLFSNNSRKFNYDFYNDIIVKTKYDELYIIDNQELLDNGFITDTINCEHLKNDI